MTRLLWLATLLSAATFAADITGKWTGSFVFSMDGESHSSTIFLDLKQSGDTVSGTAGPSQEKQWNIKSGKANGNKISFTVDSDGGPVSVQLEADGDRLTGSANGQTDEGKKLEAKIEAKRQS